MRIKRINFLFLIIVLVSFLPLFTMVNGFTFSLPVSYFESTGIPIHISLFLVVILFFKEVKKNILPFFLILSLISINLLLSVERGFLLFQALQPFLFMTVFKNTKYSIDDSLIYKCLFFFIVIIAGNLCYGFFLNGFDLLLIRNFIIENFYTIKFYQSSVSFPIFLNCILLLIIFQKKKSYLNNNIFLIFNIIIIFIQILLLRKVAIFDMLFIYSIFYPKFIKWILLFTFFLFLFLNVDVNSLEFFERIFDSNSYSSRENTWEENLNFLSNYDIIFFGIGKNTYAHNYFLGQLITFGIPLTMIIFILNFSHFFYFRLFKNKFIFTLFFIFLIDCFFNANLTQTYAIFGFSFLFIYFKNYITKRAKI